MVSGIFKHVMFGKVALIIFMRPSLVYGHFVLHGIYAGHTGLRLGPVLEANDKRDRQPQV